MQYLICYDISDDKVRARVAKYLESFAVRQQASVFLCSSLPMKLSELKAELLLLTGKKKRSLLIVPLCPSCQALMWQAGKPREEEPQFVIA